MSRQPLLIVGASGRAAAASALRAGFDPFVLDLFADADTERLCPVRKLPMTDYPHGFVELAKPLPAMPWMYTGGLENHPDVVAAISESRELWGNGPDVLAKVRDPFWVSAVLGVNGSPPLLPGNTLHLPDGQWLRKPLRGSAGFGISTATQPTTPSSDHFYQQFVAGEPVSAVFDQSKIRGITRQLISTIWLHAPRFRYAGNISLPPSDLFSLSDGVLAGLHIRRAANLVGLNGIDFISEGRRCHVLEVNPRYTASVEVIEYATRSCSLPPWGGGLGWGVSQAAQTPRLLPPNDGLTPHPNPPPQGGREQEVVVGKAIYYAPHALTFPASGPWDDALAACTDVWRRPDFADIPHAGDAIDAGQPVCTLLAEADTETACEAKLRGRAAELDRLFGHPATKLHQMDN